MADRGEDIGGGGSLGGGDEGVVRPLAPPPAPPSSASSSGSAESDVGASPSPDHQVRTTHHVWAKA